MTSFDAISGDFPHLGFAERWSLSSELNYVMGQCDAIVQAISKVPLLPNFREQLHQLSLQKGAQATTAIEGNTLSDEEVESIARGAHLPPSQEYEQREIENILAAFDTLFNEAVKLEKVEKISPDLLLRFHRMIGHDLGERFHAVPGTFAQSARMVGPYRAPPADYVPALVARLCEWLAEQFHYPRQRFSDAVIQAVVTHVYIEWIHPFDDGNGRTGRLAEFYILLRAGLPSIASHLLANHYNETRSEYYRQLQRAKQDRDLTAFLQYAVVGLRDGLMRTLRTVQKNAFGQMWRVLVYDTFALHPIKQRATFKRQRAVALALPLDRQIAFSDVPSLTPELGEAYSTLGERSILRDVKELQKLNLIVRSPGLIRANSDLLEMTLVPQRKEALVPPS
jgi:Fic family protein